MRSQIFITIIALITFNVSAQTQSPSFDLAAHQQRADALFQQHIPGLLNAEREKIEALLSNERAASYMELFERGMRAETGIIMLNTGDDYWLELAYREGYARKLLFRSGYISGLVERVEQDINHANPPE